MYGSTKVVLNFLELIEDENFAINFNYLGNISLFRDVRKDSGQLWNFVASNLRTYSLHHKHDCSWFAFDVNMDWGTTCRVVDILKNIDGIKILVEFFSAPCYFDISYVDNFDSTMRTICKIEDFRGGFDGASLNYDKDKLKDERFVEALSMTGFKHLFELFPKLQNGS